MGRTPLFYAAYYCNDYSVKYLIDHGASTSILDYSGFLPRCSLMSRMDVLQYAKGSIIPETNKDKSRKKEEILQLLCDTRQQEESDHCKRMNAAITRVRAEIQLPTTARDLSTSLFFLSRLVNCFITTSRTFFAVYSEYSKNDEGIHLTNPHFLVKRITVASECRYPHFQLFEEGYALLMAYELSGINSNQPSEDGGFTEEQCVECFNNACKVGVRWRLEHQENECSFHRYATREDNPLGDRLGFFYKESCICGKANCSLHILQRLLEFRSSLPLFFTPSSESTHSVYLRLLAMWNPHRHSV